MQNQASKSARNNAKALRVGMTDAERRLWLRLRGEQLGAKFRRQHPVGPYVLDFASLDPKLVIEVDGSQHLDQVAYDQRRSTWLAAQGFDVLRFWANEVLSETDAVVSRIQEVLAMASAQSFTLASISASAAALPQRGRVQAPTPTLPQRGREQTPDKEFLHE